MKSIAILLALLLSACATTQVVYTKHTTIEQARADHDECFLKSLRYPTDIWTDQDRIVFEDCLEQKGYVPAVVDYNDG